MYKPQMLAFAVTLAPVAASAEGPSTTVESRRDSPAERFTGTISTGFIVPTGGTGDRFDTGWSLAGSLGYFLHDQVAVSAEGLVSWYGVEGSPAFTDIVGDHRMSYLAATVQYRLFPQGPFNLYAIGGPGAYYRKISISQIEGAAVGTYCDPYFFYCSPAAVPITDVLRSEDSWDFGLSGGLGLSFGPSPDAPSFYAEARYHYMWGPEFTDANGNQRHANGQYLPIVIGVMF